MSEESTSSRVDDGVPADRHLAEPVSRAQLYEMVWQEPMMRVAARYGVSSSYLARVCTELRIPRPARGYWAQLVVNKAPSKAPLPAVSPGELGSWRPGSHIGTTQRIVRKRAASASRSAPLVPS